jgi:Zn-dependent protease with chaperone function
MSGQAAPKHDRRPRLNPFAFPSDTTFRFVLLVVAVLGSTLYVWNWIYAAVGDHAARFARASRDCLTEDPARFTGLDEFTASRGAFTRCVQASNRPIAWWMLGGLALVAVLAVVLTLAQPWWRRRRLRLKPLRQEDAPAVVAEVAALAREAGLREPPALVWNPLDRSPTGLAFGHAGSYTVALTGGLVVRQTVDPEAFRAVVRHELAHIRNRDVDLTYLTISLWHAFLLGALVPFIVTLLDESASTVTGVGWRIGALALLVYLTRNAVLRSRELYADVRASAAPGAADGVRRALAGLPRPRRDAFGGLFRLHPRPAERLAAVEDTRPLFAHDLATAVGAGVAATIADESVV